MPAGAVSVLPNTLVTPPPDNDAFVLDRFKVRCAFCRGAQRVWGAVTGYWSHLRYQHGEIPEADRVREIQKTARQYKEWAEIRGLDYRQNNPTTWRKIQQTQAANFNWEIVENWRSRLDPRYQHIQAATEASMAG